MQAAGGAGGSKALPLRAALARSDKRAAKVSQDLEAREAKKASIKFGIIRAGNLRNDARRDKAAAQGNVVAQAEAARQSDLPAPPARDVAPLAKRVTKSAALQTVNREPSSSLLAFDAKRSKMREELGQLLSSGPRHRPLFTRSSSSLERGPPHARGQQRTSGTGPKRRPGPQVGASRGKIEAGRSAKRASDDLRVL